MSFSTFNTNFLKGSYINDVTFLLKIAENAPLAKGINTSGLHPHIDGKQNLAIGYGYDFAANGVVQSILDLKASGALITDEAALKFELAKLTAGHATAAQQATIANLVNLQTEGVASVLLAIAIQHRDRPINPDGSIVNNSFEGFLLSNGINLPDSRERAVLMSMWYQLPGAVGKGGYFINKTGGLSNMSQALIDDNRSEVWYQIRYQSSNNGTDGAMRRFAEAEMFGLYSDPTNVTPDVVKQIYRMFTLHRDKIMSYESNFGNHIASANANYGLTGTDQVDHLVQALNPARDAIISDLQSSYPSLAGKDLSSYLSTSIYLDPNRNNEGDQLNSNHAVTLNVRQKDAAGNEIASNDILIGEDGDDILVGGKGDDILIGGKGLDNYIWNTGDGTDTIIDEDKQGVIVINNGNPQHLFAVGAFVETAPGSGVWQQTMADGSVLTLTHHSPWRLVTADGSEIILGNDWQDGDFGIHLQSTLAAISTGLTITGDLILLDTNATTAGVQTQTDELGNVITDPNQSAPNQEDTLYDSAGNDRLQGLGGQDTLNGLRGGDDILEGGADSDVLLGGDGDDRLYSNTEQSLAAALAAGATGAATGQRGDLLAGGIGNDQVYGGNGNDALAGGDGADMLTGGLGDDVLLGDDNFTSASKNWSVTQTHQSDGQGGLIHSFSVIGISYQPLTNGGADLIYGGAGADLVFAGFGNDMIDAGTDNDVVFGDAGHDVIQGQSGNDILIGDGYGDVPYGNDYIFGGDGNDWLYGTGGDDYLDGGNGDDVLLGDHNGGSINADGVDVLNGGLGNDWLYGGGKDDILSGDAGDDTLYGEDGNDWLDGGVGNDSVDGEEGNDILSGGTGNDTLDGGAGDDMLNGGAGRDLLLGGAGNDVYLISANAGADLITDMQGQNVICFAEGISAANVTISEFTIAAQTALTIQVNGMDAAIITAGLGNYSFEFADGSRMSANEFLLNFRTGARTIYGGDNNNTIYGGQANDTLHGEKGNDILWGGTGDDLLDGGLGSDGYRYRLGDGQDTIEESDDFVAGHGSQDRVVFGPGIGLNDVIFNHRSNGDLSLSVAGVVDAIIMPSWYTDPSRRVESFVFTDDSEITADTLALLDVTSRQGTAGNDQLSGTKYRDIMLAGSGDDLLMGNGGNDDLYGETGTDTYRLSLGSSTAQVFEVEDETSVIEVLVCDLSRLTGTRVGDDLLLGVIGVGDNLMLKNFYTMHHDWQVKDQTSVTHGLAELLAENIVYRENRSEIERLQEEFIAGTQDKAVQYYQSQGMKLQADGTWWTPLQITATQRVDNYARSPGYSGYVPSGSNFYNWDALGLMIGKFSVSSYLSDASEINYNVGGPFTATKNVQVDWAGVQAVSSSSIVNSISSGHYLYTTEEALALMHSLGVNGIENPYIYTYTPKYIQTTTITRQVATVLSVMPADGNAYDIYGAGPESIFQLANLPSNLSVTAQNANVSIGIMIAGEGNNTITISDGIVHAGGGNDTITINSVPWSNTGSQNILVNTLLDGGSGDDLIIGSLNNDMIIGGSGNDLLQGGSGNDRYYFMTGDIGVDLIFDTGYTGYNMDEDGYLVDADIVVFSEGINLFSFSFSWGSEALYPYMGGSTKSYQTLNISWQPDVVVKIAMPRADEYNYEKTGIEFFEFADGSRMTMAEMLTLAADLAPVINIPLADQTATEDMFFSFTIPFDAFVDQDTEDLFSYDYFYVIHNNDASEHGYYPNWLNFNYDTRTFSGTPDAYLIGGSIDITVIATDHFGVSISDTFNLAISPINKLIGSAENDTLRGTKVADELIGLSGNDVLNGGLGADMLVGGQGNDTYIVDNSLDVVIEALDEGIDKVRSSINYILTNNVENLILTGTASIDGTGNTLNNILNGNSAANVLNGVSGADTMIGRAGNDTYVVDNTLDLVIEALNKGIDTVEAGITYTLGANVENLILTGTSSINGTGNILDNVLIGNSAANILSGGIGADVMTGGLSDDTYIVDNALDVVREDRNEGIDLVQAKVNYTLLANVENLTLTGATAINGTGNELDNVLTGNSGANTLVGGAGNDRLIGGAGVDTMRGGIGDDTYVVNISTDVITENASEGIDTVESGVTYTLGANLENLRITGTAARNGSGNALNNIITGNSAANKLNGGAGNDILTGGAGIDHFQFTTTLGASNVDTLTDFVSGTDKIDLSKAIFTAFSGLTVGRSLNSAEIGNHVLYDANTGFLSYDADGSAGAGAAVKIALVGATNHPTALQGVDFNIAA